MGTRFILYDALLCFALLCFALLCFAYGVKARAIDYIASSSCFAYGVKARTIKKY